MRGRCGLGVAVGLHASDIFTLCNEADAERTEDGEEFVKADAGGITELERGEQAFGHTGRRGELGAREP